MLLRWCHSQGGPLCDVDEDGDLDYGTLAVREGGYAETR